MESVIAKTYPFILLCALLSKELDGGAACFLPDEFQSQFRALRKKDVRDLQKNIPTWKNRFPEFLEKYHKSIMGDKLCYDPVMYKYVAYKLIYECYRHQAKPDFDLHRCIMRFSNSIEPQYKPYYAQYRDADDAVHLLDALSSLNKWAAGCEAGVDAPAGLSDIEGRIESIRVIRMRL